MAALGLAISPVKYAARVMAQMWRQSPVAPDPGEEALDDPASRLDGEADLIAGLAHDLDCDRGGAGDALASVAGIGEDALDEGE